MAWGIKDTFTIGCMIINLDTGANFYWHKYENIWYLYFDSSSHDNTVPISIMEIFESDFSIEFCNDIMESIFNELKNNRFVDFDTIYNDCYGRAKG